MLVLFKAEWCRPCEAFAPLVESVVKELGVELKVVDVDDYPEEARAMGVRGVPTLVVQKEEGITMLSNLPNKEKIKEEILNALV